MRSLFRPTAFTTAGSLAVAAVNLASPFTEKQGCFVSTRPFPAVEDEKIESTL